MTSTTRWIAALRASAVPLLLTAALSACDGSGGASGPTVTLDASATAIDLGASSTLTWSSEGATACTASGGWTGARATSGTEAVTPAAAGGTVYTLTCTGAEGSGSDAVTITATAVAGASGSVSGRVLNTVDGAPISGATVRVGGLTAISGDDGSFLIANVPAGARQTVEVEAAGFEDSFRIASVVGGEEVAVSVQAVPVGTSDVIDPSAGGDVTLPGSTAQVSFPANAIDATGPVTVTLTDVNPGSSAGNMPGDYTTVVGDSEELIESFGAIAVRLRDAGGADVDLRTGSTATLRIPLSSRNTSPPPTVPLWFYDETAGRWVQEGTATLVVAGADSYYEGTVAHFTTWNADVLYDSVNITGCVSDGQNAVSGVSVTGTGIDYTGTSSARSGSNGQFTIRARPNSNLTLSGVVGDSTTSTLAVQTGGTDIDLTANCLQVALATEAISIRLSWGATPNDLDSRIYLPEGGEVSYEDEGSLSAAPFVSLDVDDVDSFGPEVITIARPKVGTYRYYVNNYDEFPVPGITASPARVELTANNQLRVFTPPAGEGVNSLNWTVFDLNVAADCTVTVVPSTTPWTSAFPDLPAAPNPDAAFCTR